VITSRFAHTASYIPKPKSVKCRQHIKHSWDWTAMGLRGYNHAEADIQQP